MTAALNRRCKEADLRIDALNARCKEADLRIGTIAGCDDRPTLCRVGARGVYFGTLRCIQYYSVAESRVTKSRCEDMGDRPNALGWDQKIIDFVVDDRLDRLVCTLLTKDRSYIIVREYELSAYFTVGTECLKETFHQTTKKSLCISSPNIYRVDNNKVHIRQVNSAGRNMLTLRVRENKYVKFAYKNDKWTYVEFGGLKCEIQGLVSCADVVDGRWVVICSHIHGSEWLLFMDLTTGDVRKSIELWDWNINNHVKSVAVTADYYLFIACWSYMTRIELPAFCSRVARPEALLMALHPRLGARSAIRELGVDLMALIWDYAVLSE